MGIQDRDWYKEAQQEKGQRERVEQDQAWNSLKSEGVTLSAKQKRWNRRMPKPGEVRHRSQTSQRQWNPTENTPTWKYLFYWSFSINVILIAGIAYYVIT